MNARSSSGAERDTNAPKVMQRDDFFLILPFADECPEFIERRARHEPPQGFFARVLNPLLMSAI
ncbi:hypothetical protein D2T32_04405 [Sinirhodobacter populi]|nr:hypothetical protein D2T32_04405 [Sinirhodobacter populi]